MKLICDQHRTAEALAAITTVASARHANPVVLNTRLVAVDDRLEFYATDFEVSLTYIVGGVDVKTPGEVCMPAKRLGDIFRELPKGDATLDGDSRGAKITTAGVKFNVLGIDPEEFPRLPVFDEAESFAIPAKDFKEMVDRVSFAVAMEKGRYALNGVLFDIKKKKLELVASDGKRLAHISRKLEVGRDYSDTIIVPVKGLNLIEKVISADDDEIRIQVRENQLLAKTGPAVVAAQLVEGLFPDYNAVIPKGHDKKAIIGKAEFGAGLRRASLLADEDTMSVRFAFSKDTVTLTARSPEAGEAEITLDIEYQDDDLEIGFDPRYLMDVLKHLRGDDVVIELKDKDSACVIKDGKDYIYVVMPTEID